MIIYLIYPILVILSYHLIKDVYKEEHNVVKLSLFRRIIVFILAMTTLFGIFLVLGFYTARSSHNYNLNEEENLH